MNTMQLACFLTVAETLSFARAAEQLHVTQPAVTQQIHSLESELNTQLFRRTTRTVELTQAGLIFLGDAKLMLEISERARLRAEHAVEDLRQPFVIGCHADADVFRLAETLRRMAGRFPDLYPVFRVVPFRRLYQRLLEETVDVVVAFREGGLRKSIRYRELARPGLVALVDPGHPLAGAGEVEFASLREYPIVALSPQRSPEGYRSQLHALLDGLPPERVYFCESVETAAVLAEGGFGAAVVPDLFRGREPGLVLLPIADAQPLSYGVYYKSLAEKPRRRAFVELTAEAFAAAVQEELGPEAGESVPHGDI